MDPAPPISGTAEIAMVENVRMYTLIGIVSMMAWILFQKIFKIRHRYYGRVNTQKSNFEVLV